MLHVYRTCWKSQMISFDPRCARGCIYYTNIYLYISAIIWKWINAIKCYKISISSWDVFSLNFHIQQLQRHCLLHTNGALKIPKIGFLSPTLRPKKRIKTAKKAKKHASLTPPHAFAFGQWRGGDKTKGWKLPTLQSVRSAELAWPATNSSMIRPLDWQKKSPKLLWPDQWLDSDKLRQLAGTFVNIHQSNMDVDMFHIEHEEIPWISICFCPVLKRHWFQLDISIPNSSWPQRQKEQGPCQCKAQRPQVTKCPKIKGAESMLTWIVFNPVTHPCEFILRDIRLTENVCKDLHDTGFWHEKSATDGIRTVLRKLLLSGTFMRSKADVFPYELHQSKRHSRSGVAHPVQIGKDLKALSDRNLRDPLPSQTGRSVRPVGIPGWETPHASCKAWAKHV